ncbi:condensation domain-containing protein [Plantactinospora sp. B6F1]|uniref:condensation domain-containing protein n=1 Tax=Plantactinospora sp. B6F1 TaxID=3158971 RepID=UPI00102C3806
MTSVMNPCQPEPHGTHASDPADGAGGPHGEADRTSPCPARPLLPGARHEPVAFTSAERPTGPVTWAQQHLLAIMAGLHPHTASLNLRFAWPLRSGVPLPEVLEVLRDLITLHEALRTVFFQSADGLRQRVLSSGRLFVEVSEVGAEPAAVDHAVDTLAGEPFDFTNELPVRVALLTSGGQPWYLVFAACHLVIDFTGAWHVGHGLRPLLTEPDKTHLPGAARPAPGAWQPLDQAGWESSSAGLRLSERALAQHERTFRAMPQTMLPRPAREPEEPRFRYVRLDSPALALAVPVLAARHQVSRTAVLAAGICAVAGYVSGLERAFLQLTVGNRMSARTRSAVGMFTQDVPIHVEMADASITDLLTRTEAAVVTAARFGQYPPGPLAVRRRQIEIDRGLAFDLSCWLNNRLRHAPGTAPVRPDRRLLEAAAKRSRCRWVGADKSSTSTYFVYADDAGDALRLTMLLDTAMLPGEEGPAWLRAVERLLCAAVVADIGIPDVGDLVDLSPTERNDDWCLTGAGWVHLPSATGLLRRAAGTDRCAVTAASADGGALLTAYLDAGGRQLDIERLHADIVGMLPGMRTAAAPHRYVACDGVPTGPGPGSEVGGWAGLPVLAASTGRPTRPLVPDHATQEDLLA